MAKVYILILNYKRWQDVIDCLNSIFQLQYKNFIAIVVDNDSQNNSLQYLMDWADANIIPGTNPDNRGFYKYFHSNELNDSIDFNSQGKLIFIQNKANEGFAKGNNLVLKHLLKSDGYIWLLNPDMVVKNDTLDELVRFVNQQPFNSITGSVIRSFWQKEKICSYGGAKINFNSATILPIKKEGEVNQIDYIYGGSLFTHTNHFRDIGLLPEDYFLFWEEADWCYQARMKGYNLLFCPKSICYDKISTSIGKGFLADYYYTRNGFLFLAKYKREKIRIAFVYSILRFSVRIVTGRWNKAKGVFRGTLDFLKGRTHEIE